MLRWLCSPTKAGAQSGLPRQWHCSVRGPRLRGDPQPVCTTWSDRLPGLRPVGEKAFDTLFGQDMLEQPLDDRWRRGHHVGADLRGFEHMDAVAYACDEYFGVEGVIVVDQPNVGDELHAVEAIVVVAAEIGRAHV